MFSIYMKSESGDNYHKLIEGCSDDLTAKDVLELYSEMIPIEEPICELSIVGLEPLFKSTCYELIFDTSRKAHEEFNS